MSDIQRDCAFYKSDNTDHGCIALNKLYCKKDDEPCKFKRPKSFQITQKKKTRETK